MTNDELLDRILQTYLWSNKLAHDNFEKYEKLNFVLIVKSLKPDAPQWQINIFRQTLLGDKFLHSLYPNANEPYVLTTEGIKAAQIGWYTKQTSDRQTDDELKKHTIADLKRSKQSLFISILAFIVPTIFSVYTLWTGNQQATKSELQELHLQIQKLELEIEAKTTSIDSATVRAGDLKKESDSTKNLANEK